MHDNSSNAGRSSDDEKMPALADGDDLEESITINSILNFKYFRTLKYVFVLEFFEMFSWNQMIVVDSESNSDWRIEDAELED